MSILWDVFWFLLANWYAVAWVGAVILAYVIGGRKWALAVATLGIGSVIYEKGRKAGEERIKRKNEEAKDALQKHYDDIEAGNPADLDRDIERLRDHARRRGVS